MLKKYRYSCGFIIFSLLLFSNSCGPRIFEIAENINFSRPEKVYEGPKISKPKLTKILKEVGFKAKQIPIMLCIAEKESSFYEKARHYNKNGSIDRGLFQINNYYWGEEVKNGCHFNDRELLESKKNTLCARKVFLRHGFKAWYGYRKHKKECHNYR